jgi:hypothetical protein
MSCDIISQKKNKASKYDQSIGLEQVKQAAGCECWQIWSAPTHGFTWQKNLLANDLCVNAVQATFQTASSF